MAFVERLAILLMDGNLRWHLRKRNCMRLFAVSWRRPTGRLGKSEQRRKASRSEYAARVATLVSILMLHPALNVEPAAAQRPTEITLPAPDRKWDEEFTRIVAVIELSDGSMLVGDSYEVTLKHLFPGGEVRQIGRIGDGPGEFRALNGLFSVRGDTAFVHDAQLVRVLVVAGGRILDRTINLGQLFGRTASVAGADARGNLLLLRRYGATRVALRDARLVIDSIHVMRTEISLSRVDTVVHLGGRVRRVQTGGTMTRISTSPLASEEQTYLFPDGWMAVAYLDPYRVDWIDPEGRTIRGEPLPNTRRRVDARTRDIAVQREAIDLSIRQRNVEAIADWPEYVPAFLLGALGAGPGGNLLILRSSDAADHVVYDIISRSGTLAGTIRLPSDQRIVGAGRSSVYVSVEDDVGIERIQRHAWPVRTR